MAKYRGCLVSQPDVMGVRCLTRWLLPLVGTPRASAEPARRSTVGEGERSYPGQRRPYGARRVWRDTLALSEQCRERLIRLQALRAGPRGRGPPKGRGARRAIVDNVFDSQSQTDAPNYQWVARLICIWRAEGWLYGAVELDLYS